MKKNLTEIAGARCGFCRREGLPAKGGVDKLVKGLRAFICPDCAKRCAELLEICPSNGVMKFKPKEKK